MSVKKEKLLLSVLKILKDNVFDLKLAKQCLSCLDNRILWLELKEPESDGVTHDNWEEKYDELQEIRDLLDDIISECEKGNDINDDMEGFIERLNDYQITYGGISRLTI